MGNNKLKINLKKYTYLEIIKRFMKTLQSVKINKLIKNKQTLLTKLVLIKKYPKHRKTNKSNKVFYTKK